MKIPCDFVSQSSFSLKLGDFKRCYAAEVQEKGSFLFRQKGGGDDIVDACGDVIRLHVTEATPGERQVNVCFTAQRYLVSIKVTVD